MHSPAQDIVFRGITISAHAVVWPDLDFVLNDTEVWGNPEVFRPERFLDDQGHVTKHEELIPFSIGNRACPGESLARMELFLFITSLAQKFSFESPPGEDLSLMKVDGVFGVVHAPKPYKIVAVSR